MTSRLATSIPRERKAPSGLVADVQFAFFYILFWRVWVQGRGLNKAIIDALVTWGGKLYIDSQALYIDSPPHPPCWYQHTANRRGTLNLRVHGQDRNVLSSTRTCAYNTCVHCYTLTYGIVYTFRRTWSFRLFPWCIRWKRICCPGKPCRCRCRRRCRCCFVAVAVAVAIVVSLLQPCNLRLSLDVLFF